MASLPDSLPHDRILLTVTGLTKSYNGKPVVSQLDLTVPAGGALALMGPNGCGKSTVLRCLSGHDTADSGTVELPASPGTAVHSTRYRSEVFPIFDDFAFFPDVTVREHLEFLAGLYSVADQSQAASRALRTFDVEGIAGQFPESLSSGQIRRVAFAAATIRPWRVLLLDEPEQRLDIDGRSRLVDFLAGRLAAGHGLVFATHDRPLAERR